MIVRLKAAGIGLIREVDSFRRAHRVTVVSDQDKTTRLSRSGLFRLCAVPAAALVLSVGSRAPAQSPDAPDVLVEGTNVNGIVFQWEVTNNSKTAINYFSVPIFDINSFASPDGWTIESQPRLQNEGNFILRTDKYASMILPGRSLVFECSRPLRETGKDGRAPVTIGFEDGKEVVVGNVLAPVRPLRSERFALPVFLGLLLVIAIIYKVRRDRKTASATVSKHDSAPSSDAGE